MTHTELKKILQDRYDCEIRDITQKFEEDYCAEINIYHDNVHVQLYHSNDTFMIDVYVKFKPEPINEYICQRHSYEKTISILDRYLPIKKEIPLF